MKQKGLRKLVSMILAVVMCLGLTCTGFAATESAGTGDGIITITNAVAGETYSAYKMLDLSYNTTTKSYSYTVAAGWEEFFTGTGYGANYFTVDDNGYVTSSLQDNADELAAVAKAALTYATTKHISVEQSVVASVINEGTNDETVEAKITGLDLGYYLVDTSLGTLCSINSTDLIAEISEKNDTEPTVDKTVSNEEEGTYNQSNTASVGDSVYYKITVSDIEDKSSVVVSDTLSTGLTLNADSIAVTVGGTSITAGETTYSLNTSTANSFTITFVDSYLVGMADDIVITYYAVINENAVIYTDGTNNNKNDVTLEYGNQEKKDVVETTVYQFELKKIDNSSTPNVLPGAEFTLSKTGSTTLIAFVDNGDGTYRVATSEDETTITTIVAGDITIKGLAAGEYTLTETKAPDGYNKLSAPQTVTINENGTVSLNNGDAESLIAIVNQAGSILPSTGGMGTTIFYIVGGVLVLGAAVLFVTKKRIGSEN